MEAPPRVGAPSRGADELHHAADRPSSTDATLVKVSAAVDIPLLAVGVVAGVTGAAFALLALQVHRALHTTAFDLAFFDQIIWNTAHGRWFQTTYVPYNFLGQHFELILLPFAGLYRAGAGAQTLIVVQAVAASAAAVPLYLLGRGLVGRWPAAALALAYTVSTTLQRGVDFGFHPDLFEPLFAFSTLALLFAGRRRLALLPIVLLLATKEDAFLLVALIGWMCLLKLSRRFGAFLVAAAMVWGMTVIAVVMPALRGSHPSDLVERYGYLGSSPLSIMAGGALHPERVLSHLVQPGPAGAVFLLLLTSAFLPLVVPELLIAVVPVAMVGLLSSHAPQAALELQYGAPVLAAIFLVAPFGLQRANAWLKRENVPWRVRLEPVRLVAGAALVGSVAGALILGPFPGEGGYQSWRFHDAGEAHALASVATLIPVEARVSAQTGLAAHLSQRRQQWEFPRIESADYIVIEDGGMVSGQGRDEYSAAVARLPALGFVELAHVGPIRLFKLQQTVSTRLRYGAPNEGIDGRLQ